jgi:predicted nuclease with TOPRIM domain
LSDDETERRRLVKELSEISPDKILGEVLGRLMAETTDLKKRLGGLEEKVDDIRRSLRIMREKMGWNPEDLA